MIESVLSSIAHINQLDDLGLETLVKHVGLGQLSLEVSRPCQNQPGYVGLVVGEEELDRGLRHLPHVVVSLLHPQPGEPEGGLTSSAVLLGQVHRELVEHITSVALEYDLHLANINITPGTCLQSTKESTVTIHHNEAKPVVIGQQRCQGLSVELVVTQVERGVDWLERLKVNVDLLLLALIGDDSAAVDDEAVGRNLGVELESVLDRGDGAQD